jgi:hypothetical protein
MPCFYHDASDKKEIRTNRRRGRERTVDFFPFHTTFCDPTETVRQTTSTNSLEALGGFYSFMLSNMDLVSTRIKVLTIELEKSCDKVGLQTPSPQPFALDIRGDGESSNFLELSTCELYRRYHYAVASSCKDSHCPVLSILSPSTHDHRAYNDHLKNTGPYFNLKNQHNGNNL